MDASVARGLEVVDPAIATVVARVEFCIWMYTVVVDADSPIKLGKSGALPAILGAARLLVPKAVWEEAVEEGKRRMYEDANDLEAG